MIYIISTLQLVIYIQRLHILNVREIYIQDFLNAVQLTT